MDGLIATTSCAAGGRFPFLPLSSTRTFSFSFSPRRLSSFPVFSSRGGLPHDLNQWDQMELKFGKLIGEVPKLTFAKIMGRKENPNASYLDIEKSFQKKKKGKSADDEIVDVPLDWALEKQNEKQQQQEQHFQQLSSSMGLRPPTSAKKNSLKPEFNLMRPVSKNAGYNDVELVEKLASAASEFPVSGNHSVSLRKPDVVKVDDIELEKPRFQIKPTFFLKIRKGSVDDNSSEVNLLKKPEIMKISVKSPGENNLSSGDNDISEKTSKVSTGVFTGDRESRTVDTTGVPESAVLHDTTEKGGIEHHEEEATTCENLDVNSVQQDQESISSPASLIEKPQRHCIS